MRRVASGESRVGEAGAELPRLATRDDRLPLDFVLPPALEAHEPAELRGSGRDDVRLLVSHRGDDAIEHAHFRQLPQFLQPGDLLVLNTTATLPAAVTAHREDGEELLLHFSTPLPGGLAVVEPRNWSAGILPAGPPPSRRRSGGAGKMPADRPAGSRRSSEIPREGELLQLRGGVMARLLAPYRDSRRLWIARVALREPLHDYLRRYGRPIHYSYVEEPFPIDAYQTVFAAEAGSAEMPSAGRPFTRPMLACLRRSGVRLAKLVLHTGVASLESHERPYEEAYEVPSRTAEAVRKTKAAGGRVVAVGTTVVRALETSVDRDGEAIASKGWTDLVITPERGVRIVDGLLTGLHEPKATHLQMLEAIAGRDHVAKAYAAALEGGYLWHEFGDVHLII